MNEDFEILKQTINIGSKRSFNLFSKCDCDTGIFLNSNASKKIINELFAILSNFM